MYPTYHLVNQVQKILQILSHQNVFSLGSFQWVTYWLQKKNKDFCCTRTSLLIGEPISSHRCAGRYPFVKTCQRPFSSGSMLFLICIASKHRNEHINPIVNISIYKLVYDDLVVLLQIISNSFMRSLFLFCWYFVWKRKYWRVGWEFLRPRESDLLNLKGSRQSWALRINSDSSNALYSYHFRLMRFWEQCV